MKGIIFIGVLFVCFIFSSATFTNPIFGSQDPWVTLVDGVYYYTESYCGSADICVKASKTLTGLGSAPWIGVWSASSGAPNSGDIWAPEMHYVNGSWYIYYGADNGDNNNHRIYVLQGNSPVGQFQEANTGQPHGLLKDSTNNWGIDPDVFFAVDGHLYLTWSCTNQANANMPQRICLARMSDPVTISSQTTFLSTPTEYWETRDAPIQEGPVGYTHSGHTYITYSASASWIANDYSVGVLAYSGSGDILDAANWQKTGPILDHHGSVYGPGSVVFVPSIDGSEYWTLYHAIDRPDCSPAYSCRDIRMQKMYFDPLGYPILAYPVNPGVQLPPPAGEDGQPAGTTLIAEFGNAWGDAAEGNTGGGLVSGHWNYTDRFTATSPLGGAWDQIFSPWNPNPADVTAHVELQLVETGTTQSFPKFGFYCVYDDTNNHAEVFIDNNYKVLASHAVVGGVDQGWQNANLPAGFNANDWHSIDCVKNGNSFTFSLDGGAVSYSRSFNLNNGQTGLVVVDSHVNYRNLQLYVHY